MNCSRPKLETPRLILRPFIPADAPKVQELAGRPEIAATTAAIPHPYPDGAAEAWIATHEGIFEKKQGIHFAIVLKSTNELIGCIDFFSWSQFHSKAEIGYWVGVRHWGQGYCTEALQALVKYGFDILKLHKIIARHMSHNPASGKVMLKAGFKHEGSLREEIIKNGERVGLEVYGILNSEYQGLRR